MERFFALLTDKQLRRGVHRSTEELEAAIEHYIASVNAAPPTVSLDQIGERHTCDDQAFLPADLGDRCLSEHNQYNFGIRTLAR